MFQNLNVFLEVSLLFLFCNYVLFYSIRYQSKHRICASTKSVSEFKVYKALEFSSLMTCLMFRYNNGICANGINCATYSVWTHFADLSFDIACKCDILSDGYEILMKHHALLVEFIKLF